MLIFRIAATAHSNRLACNASDITRIQEVADGQSRITFTCESGGGTSLVSVPYEHLIEQVEQGKERESAVYAAAYKAKKTLNEIAKTIELSVRGEIEKTVIKKLETEIGQAVESHLQAMAAEQGETFDGGDAEEPVKADVKKN